jgi:hypothetical protein
MPQMTVTLIVAGAAAIALMFIASAGRKRMFHGRWDASSTYIVVVAWLLLLPAAFVQASGGVQTTTNIIGLIVALPDPRASQLNQLSALVIASVGLLTFVRGVAHHRQIYTPALLAAFLVMVTDLSSAIAGNSAPGGPRLIALVAIFVGASVLPRGAGARLGFAAVGLSVAVLSGLLVVVDFEAASRYCRVDKCGPLGNLLFGVTTGENVLGLILASSIPAVFLAFKGRYRWILSLYLLGLVYAGGSRTALQAAVAIAAVMILTRLAVDVRAAGWTKLVVYGSAVLGLAVGLVLPYLPLDPSLFTNRAHLWQIAQEQIGRSELVGFGALQWGSQVDYGGLTPDQAYSVHNQWLDIRYTAGALGLIIFVSMVSLALSKVARGQGPTALFLFLPVAFTGIFERTWAFGLLDTWGWMCAATLLCLEARRVGIDGSEDEAVDRRLESRV